MVDIGGSLSAAAALAVLATGPVLAAHLPGTNQAGTNHGASGSDVITAEGGDDNLAAGCWLLAAVNDTGNDTGDHTGDGQDGGDQVHGEQVHGEQGAGTS